MIHPEEVLSAYLDGEASPAEVRRVTAHLGDCHRCRRRLLHLSESRMAIRGLPLIELPAGLLEVAGDDAPLGRRRRSVILGTAAAVAAAFILASAVLTPSLDPIDLAEVSRQIGARASFDGGAAPLNLIVPDVGRE